MRINISWKVRTMVFGKTRRSYWNLSGLYVDDNDNDKDDITFVVYILYGWLS